MAPIRTGDVVDRYRVEQVLGVGAMGLVVSARHTKLDQVVAIKFLVEHAFSSPEESVARFVGEARAAARIDSDHVCRVFDVDILPDGVPYMVMEHLEGNDLEEELRRRGQLGVVEAVDYVLQALDAMAAAHALGVVHRDLKPANLFLARRPDGSRRVKVLDFGISKVFVPGQHRITRDKRSLGSPAYMPPEQIHDPTAVDHRADVWALGAILYELLTGQMAFIGDTVKEVLDRVLHEDPCPIPKLRADVPPGLVAIVAAALRRDVDARFPSAAEFARALAPFGSVGVTSSLASVQREVGVLPSLPSIVVRAAAPPSLGALAASRTWPAAPSAAIVTPTAWSGSGPLSGAPGAEDVGRRQVLAKGWAQLQTRRRRARSAVLLTVTLAFFAGTAAILARGVPSRRLFRTAAAGQEAPAPTAGVVQPPAVVEPPRSVPSAPDPSATPPVVVAPTESAASTSKNVHHAPTCVRSARTPPVRPPRGPAVPGRD